MSKLMHNLNRGKSSSQMWATFVIFIKLPKDNNRPLGENSPNLGPMLCFFKYFRRKIQQKMAFFDSKQSKIKQKFDNNIGF
jgi:hypothetical protein